MVDDALGTYVVIYSVWKLKGTGNPKGKPPGTTISSGNDDTLRAFQQESIRCTAPAGSHQDRVSHWPCCSCS